MPWPLGATAGTWRNCASRPYTRCDESGDPIPGPPDWHGAPRPDRPAEEMLPLRQGSPPADCGPRQPGKTHIGSGSAAGVAQGMSVAGHPAAGAPPTTDGRQRKTRVAEDLCRADWPHVLGCPRNDAAVVPRSAKPQDDHHGLPPRDAHHPLPSPFERRMRCRGRSAAAPHDLPGDHRGGDRRSDVQSEVSWATEALADGGLGSDPSDSSESRS